MKKIFAILAGAALLGSCCGSCPEVSPLQVDGTQLCYAESGQPAVFHGISFGWHNLWPRFCNAEAVRNLNAATGAVLFRAAIGSDDFALKWNPGCDHGYIEDKDLALKCFDAIAEGAIFCGAYVIADWHSHLSHPEQAAEFFDYVSKKYADCPNVIYELFNEPVCFSFEADTENGYGDLGNPEAMKAYWQHLKKYSEDLIALITANSHVHPLILVGCPSWDQRIDLPAEDPITCYDNLMYTVHFYAGTHKDDLRAACDAALAKGAPIFISECACCDASGDGEMDLESWALWSGWADANGISMVTWSIGDKDETCSMFTPEASSEGPWGEEVLKPWTKIVYDWI